MCSTGCLDMHIQARCLLFWVALEPVCFVVNKNSYFHCPAREKIPCSFFLYPLSLSLSNCVGKTALLDVLSFHRSSTGGQIWLNGAEATQEFSVFFFSLFNPIHSLMNESRAQRHATSKCVLTSGILTDHFPTHIAPTLTDKQNDCAHTCTVHDPLIISPRALTPHTHTHVHLLSLFLSDSLYMFKW